MPEDGYHHKIWTPRIRGYAWQVRGSCQWQPPWLRYENQESVLSRCLDLDRQHNHDLPPLLRTGPSTCPLTHSRSLYSTTTSREGLVERSLNSSPFGERTSAQAHKTRTQLECLLLLSTQSIEATDHQASWRVRFIKPFIWVGMRTIPEVVQTDIAGQVAMACMVVAPVLH